MHSVVIQRILVPKLRRGGLLAGSLLLAASAASAQATNAQVDELAGLVAKAMPVGEVFDQFIAQDPRWPMGDKASRVSEAQLGCLRQRLSTAGFRELRRGETARFAQRHPDKVAGSIDVLKGGAAEALAESVRLGAEQERTGVKADFNALAARYTPGQLSAFVDLTSGNKHAALRELIGLDNVVDRNKTAEQNQAAGRQQGQTIGVKLMLGALDHCKVPLAAVQ